MNRKESGKDEKIRLQDERQRKSILCRLGLHQWSKPQIIHYSGSNIKDTEQYCLRCGASRRKVSIAEPKKN